MDYFVLKAEKPLEEGQHPYNLPGLVNQFMQKSDMLPPTQVSIQNRHLEWLIPNNSYNQSWISQHYSHFTVLEAGKESKIPNVPLMPGLPEPKPFEKPPTEEADAKSINTSGEDAAGSTNEPTNPAISPEPEKLSPNEIKELKSQVVEKLKELGVTPPKNSTLKTLRALLEKAIKK